LYKNAKPSPSYSKGEMLLGQYQKAQPKIKILARKKNTTSAGKIIFHSFFKMSKGELRFIL
jgi:hypothetical protein